MSFNKVTPYKTLPSSALHPLSHSLKQASHIVIVVLQFVCTEDSSWNFPFGCKCYIQNRCRETVWISVDLLALGHSKTSTKCQQFHSSSSRSVYIPDDKSAKAKKKQIRLVWMSLYSIESRHLLPTIEIENNTICPSFSIHFFLIRHTPYTHRTITWNSSIIRQTKTYEQYYSLLQFKLNLFTYNNIVKSI